MLKYSLMRNIYIVYKNINNFQNVPKEKKKRYHKHKQFFMKLKIQQ